MLDSTTGSHNSTINHFILLFIIFIFWFRAVDEVSSFRHLSSSRKNDRIRVVSNRIVSYRMWRLTASTVISVCISNCSKRNYSRPTHADSPQQSTQHCDAVVRTCRAYVCLSVCLFGCCLLCPDAAAVVAGCPSVSLSRAPTSTTVHFRVMVRSTVKNRKHHAVSRTHAPEVAWPDNQAVAGSWRGGLVGCRTSDPEVSDSIQVGAKLTTLGKLFTPTCLDADTLRY